MQIYFAVSLVITVIFVISSWAVVQQYVVYPLATCQLSHADECLTLSHILNETDKYFTCNSTLVFHQGEHILQGQVLSIFISNFTLQGYRGNNSGLSTPTITCVSSHLLNFYHVSIKITSIHFNHCNIHLLYADVTLQDITFYNGRAVHGGALAVQHSRVQFSGANRFAGNMAERYGGAIYADRSTVTFSGSTVFKTNHAQRGGAVYCRNGTGLRFIGNSSFTKNTAECCGGVVYILNKNTLSLNANSSFTNNTAKWHGGAVYAEVSNTLGLSGNNIFVNNTAYHGGAVYAGDNNTLYFSGNNNFMSNTAVDGSALYAGVRTTFSFNGNCSFSSNTAYIAGAAVFAGTRNTLRFNGHSSFTNNTARWCGGAVYADNSNTLSFNWENNFMSNTAPFGGAVDVEDSNTFSFTGNSSFMSNTASRFGGAVLASNNNKLSFSGTTQFLNNTASGVGGAVFAVYKTTLTFNRNSCFIRNTAGDSGALHAQYSNNLTFNGNSNFIRNTANIGGAVLAWDSNTLSFNGNSRFMYNTAEFFGGAVFVLNNNILSFKGSNSFMNNMADIDGGAVSALGSNMSFNGSSSFTNNSAGDGGAVYAENSNTLSFSGSSSFMNNKADDDGGAVCVRKSNMRFYGFTELGHNEAAQGGEAGILSNSQLYLSGMTSLLHYNIATFGGGVFVQDSSINSTKDFTVTVLGNNALNGGGLFVQSSEITLKGVGLFLKNLATNLEGGYGGAIFARSSIVEFQGWFDVINNTAEFGGGMAFFGVHDGVLIVKDGTNLSFEGNLAHRRGGAMFVEDDPFTFCTFDQYMQNHVDEICFFQMRKGPYSCFEYLDNDYQPKSITLKLYNNSASVSGDNLYGGHLESCVVCSGHSGSIAYTLGTETFKLYAESKIDVHVFSKLSSDPYKVCICEDGNPNCDQREVNRTIYPGQVIVAPVVAVGHMNGTVPSVVRAVFDNLILTSDFKETQPAENNKECSQLQYPLFSASARTSLKLYSNEPCSTSGYPLTFLINFLPCPIGFTLSEQGACICDERLQKYTQNCNIENLSISRDAGESFWVGIEEIDKLILHPHCPFDYCTVEPAYFPLNSTDMQCANGRSGILCGACQPGRGLALGSSRCLSDCSNSFVALLLAFLFAGVALVAFLFLCHLTVAEGTLSGLVFYANVLAVNQTVFFPTGEQNLLTVFIAWLNLDLGLETCFFVSLNAYYRTWLQFAFPTYVWVIVGTIIVIAERSVRFARIIGSTNPVAVLATLFLLSYTKLLRAIMAAFSFTTLDYPDGNSKYVWLYDGNIGYLDKHDGRHIALFLFSLLFLLFIFIPYTLLLLCGQWIQRKLWWLSTTKQLYLKFFLDAHYGPYNNRHRYWTGLLLLLRFLMLLVAAITDINNPQDPFSNLLVILVVSLSLILWGWIAGRFYKSWHHDLMEASFIFNLIVLSGGTLQVRLSGGNQAALVCTSVSIAFVTFIGIILSAVIQGNKGKLRNHLHTVICYRFIRNDHDQNDEDCSVPTATPMTDVTYSVVKIDHNESGNVEHETEPTTSESTN